MTKVETGKAVMIDKGFRIDEVCNTYNVKIIRPPFLRKNKLSQEEAKLNLQIARARIHIKRVNKRIKHFKILSGKFTVNLISKSEDILFTPCAINNKLICSRVSNKLINFVDSGLNNFFNVAL